MQAQNAIRNTQIQLPNRYREELPSAPTTYDSERGDGGGDEEAEERDDDVEVAVGVGAEGEPGGALQGEKGDGVVG